jgi:hypothetical protein
LLVLILPLLVLRLENVALEVQKDGLRITGSVHGRSIAYPETTFARRLTANDTPAYWSKVRTNGIRLPNYKPGWFRLQNGEKALLFVTDWSKTVGVPTDEGYVLIASPDDPEGFLTAIQGQKAASEVSRIFEPVRFPLAPAGPAYRANWVVSRSCAPLTSF